MSPKLRPRSEPPGKGPAAAAASLAPLTGRMGACAAFPPRSPAQHQHGLPRRAGSEHPVGKRHLRSGDMHAWSCRTQPGRAEGMAAMTVHRWLPAPHPASITCRMSPRGQALGGFPYCYRRTTLTPSPHTPPILDLIPKPAPVLQRERDPSTRPDPQADTSEQGFSCWQSNARYCT